MKITEVHYVNGPLKSDGPEPIAIPLDIDLPVAVPIYRPLSGASGESEESMEGYCYYLRLFDGEVIGQQVLPIPAEMIMAMIEKRKAA